MPSYNFLGILTKEFKGIYDTKPEMRDYIIKEATNARMTVSVHDLMEKMKKYLKFFYVFHLSWIASVNSVYHINSVVESSY